jgi:hypothetical protein
MFADIEADIYVMADGDATYDASRAPELVDHLIGENLDMVVGARGEVERTSAYRPGHKLGNWILTRTVTLLFGQGFSDILSGYRVFSRRYVKTFPALATGFEIETELSVHALQLRMPVAEIETRYDARMAGSESKLNTWRDGFRILSTIMLLLKEVRPLFFFGSFSALLVIAAFILALPLLTTYMETGLVPRFPTAILSTGMVLLAFLSLTSGVILDSLSRARLETKRMRYLELSTVSYTTPSEDVTRHER